MARAAVDGVVCGLLDGLDASRPRGRRRADRADRRGSALRASARCSPGSSTRPVVVSDVDGGGRDRRGRAGCGRRSSRSTTARSRTLGARCRARDRPASTVATCGSGTPTCVARGVTADDDPFADLGLPGRLRRRGPRGAARWPRNTTPTGRRRRRMRGVNDAATRRCAVSARAADADGRIGRIAGGGPADRARVVGSRATCRRSRSRRFRSETFEALLVVASWLGDGARRRPALPPRRRPRRTAPAGAGSTSFPTPAPRRSADRRRRPTARCRLEPCGTCGSTLNRLDWGEARPERLTRGRGRGGLVEPVADRVPEPVGGRQDRDQRLDAPVVGVAQGGRRARVRGDGRRSVEDLGTRRARRSAIASSASSTEPDRAARGVVRLEHPAGPCGPGCRRQRLRAARRPPRRSRARPEDLGGSTVAVDDRALDPDRARPAVEDHVAAGSSSSPRSSRTWPAVVGLTAPKRLADGAATGRRARAARGRSGGRDAQPDGVRPPVTIVEDAVGPRHDHRQRPGHGARRASRRVARARAQSSRSSASARWTISG